MNLNNLAEYRTPTVSREVLETMLLADQTGASVPTEKEAPAKEDKPTVTDEEGKTTEFKASNAARAEPGKVDPTPPAGEKKLSVVEQLRARAAAQKAKEAV
jgi:hypothetical protein